jgi:hypothetical protein
MAALRTEKIASFRLTPAEGQSIHRSRSQVVTLKRGHNLKYLPYVFTEQGVAMLSSVLRSARAIEVNIAIMRTFVQLRRLMDSKRHLARKSKGWRGNTMNSSPWYSMRSNA